MYFGPERLLPSMAKEQSIEESGELFDDVVSYLTIGEYPACAGSNQKRSIWRKVKKFIVRQGKVFYKNKVSYREVILGVSCTFS